MLVLTPKPQSVRAEARAAPDASPWHLEGAKMRDLFLGSTGVHKRHLGLYMHIAYGQGFRFRAS